MAGTGTHSVGSCEPLHYMTPEELARLDKVFDSALQDATCLVFWTGISFHQAQCWATQHGLKTLAIAMGPLYLSHEIEGARYGKSPKAWSKYMKGASGRFAEYACRGGRQAVVLTNPPPDVYSSREQSSYRQIEEPILKGVAGGSGTARIEYVHPMIKKAAELRYQVWPQNASSAWDAILVTLSCGSMDVTKSSEVAVGRKQTCKVLQKIKVAVSHKAQAELKKMKEKANLDFQTAERAQEKKMAKEERKRRRAERKKAKREKAKLEQRRAEEKKKASIERTNLEQQKAQERKKAKTEKANLEQQKVIEEKKERKRANIERAKLERQEAQERKWANKEKVKLDQQKVQERKKANREKTKLEQQRAKEMKEAKQLAAAAAAGSE